MRTEQDRYVYSAIDERPALRLPGGARIAVWIATNHEFYELDPPRRGSRAPWARPAPDVLAYSHRDFGNRVGVWRTIEMLDRLGMRASVSQNVAALEHHPEIAQACVERGWEIFSHGIYNTRYLLDLDEPEERAVIADVIETVIRCTGQRPVGWLSPALTNTPRTLDLLAEHGFTYTCDLFHDDQPFPVRVRSGRLISLPYTLDLNDVVVLQSYLYSPDDYARMIIDQFDVLHAEGERSARVMCVALHPYLVGQAHRVRPLERALEHIAGRDDVWIATGREIADWYLREHYDEVAAAVGHRSGP